MTRQEAVERLKSIKSLVDKYDDVVALREAVKALEQEPCEDAISRQAAIDGLVSIAKAKAKSDAQKSLMGRIMFFTERLPSVNPQEPKTDVLDKIRAEIAEYKDDKVIHDERNEMIDIVLDIIDKYKVESEEQA